MKDTHNKQTVILRTLEGTAKSAEQLVEVWNHRLEKVAPHYEVISIKIEVGLGKRM